MNVEISGLPVSVDSFEDVLADMAAQIEAGSYQNYVSITNTESMYHALRMPEHFEFIKDSNHSLCDGIGVRLAGFFWGVNVPRRNGPVLMLHACDAGQALGWKHYLYGGKDGVAEMLEEKLKGQFPDLVVVGRYCPPFRPLSPEEKKEVIEDIQRTRPDIIWVGLGLLKQEAWIAEFSKEVNVPWMIGVGAAFDYHAGTVPWAPKWIRAMGMEWLYRTILQPKLRIKRYVWSFHYLFEAMFAGVIHQVKKSVGGKT